MKARKQETSFLLSCFADLFFPCFELHLLRPLPSARAYAILAA
jgi:hypothetical protein